MMAVFEFRTLSRHGISGILLWATFLYGITAITYTEGNITQLLYIYIWRYRNLKTKVLLSSSSSCILSLQENATVLHALPTAWIRWDVRRESFWLEMQALGAVLFVRVVISELLDSLEHFFIVSVNNSCAPFYAAFRFCISYL